MGFHGSSGRFITKKVSIKDLSKQDRKLLRRHPAAVEKLLYAGAKRAEAILRMVTYRQTPLPIFSGNFVKSWVTERVSNGFRAYNRMPYAYVIDQGRRPGAKQPPSDKLKPWVKRKIAPPAKKLDSISFLVARAIGEHGIKGLFIVDQAMPIIEDRFDKLTNEALDRLHRGVFT